VFNLLNNRAREVFRHIVDAYCLTGEPIGSQTLSDRLEQPLSSSSIRAIMADLEKLNLLHSPHTSAGRLPTEMGLRLYVDGLLEIGDLSEEERHDLGNHCRETNGDLEAQLEQTTLALSGLSQCASLVFAPKFDQALRHIEFVRIGSDRALVIILFENGMVENRLISIPVGLPLSHLTEAGNYLTHKLAGKTFSEVMTLITKELEQERQELSTLSKKLVEDGLAVWSQTGDNGTLILKGQANLLQDVQNSHDIDRVRALFETLDTKKNIMDLLDSSIDADGVQIFVGSNNPLFRHSGCSMIIAPYKTGRNKVIGAIGVIGPTHINYARIVPMVDYTAKMISQLVA